jgi:predicted O-linked N-acetylglucosamine transferase (SPINDLY family)
VEGVVTFGAVCDLARLTPAVAETWTQILRQVPRARLCLGNVRRITNDIGDRAIALFAHFGVADRIDFFEPAPGAAIGPEFFARVDLFLDTHPVAGFVDACHALWMGVPVIARAGARRSSLMTASVLNAAGKSQWIADSDERFVEAALALAASPFKLAPIRQRLRDEVRGSALFDTQRFVRAMEKVYRQAWDETVDRQGA